MKCIKSFKDKDMQKIYEGRFSKKVPTDIAGRASGKLRSIDSSENIEDLRVPPSNHLEKMQGDRKEPYSIAVNDQWRICFNYIDGYFFKV